MMMYKGKEAVFRSSLNLSKNVGKVYTGGRYKTKMEAWED